MSSKRLALYILLITTFVACSSAPISINRKSCDSIPEGARRLIEAYPNHVVGYEDNNIIFHDGSRMIYDDGKKRTIDQMHQEQDVEEIFYQEYDKTVFPPPYGYDPGRYRCAAFYGKIYGNSREEVIKNLVYVNWCPKHGAKPILFTNPIRCFSYQLVCIITAMPLSAKSLIIVLAVIINIAAGIPFPETSATKKATVLSLSL